jgi:PAS domain S-box-containing protein
MEVLHRMLGPRSIRARLLLLSAVTAAPFVALLTFVERWTTPRLVLGAAAFLLALGATLLIGRSIAMPIRRLSDSIATLGAGRVDESLGPIEVRSLARSFQSVLEQREGARNELMAHTRQYERILATTSEGIWAADRDGITTYVNAQMARMLERDPRDVIGQPDLAMFSEDVRPTVREQLALRRKGIAATYEITVTIGRRTAQWRIRSNPIMGAAGEYQGLVATITDVSRERAAEARASEGESQIESIFASAMDGILIIDDAQRIVMFNHAAETMFGVRAPEAIGRRVEEFMPMRFRANHEQRVREFDQHDNTRRSMGRLGEVFGLRANGEEFPIEASISHVKVGNQKLYSVILRDVTDRIAADRALRESEQRLASVLGLARAGVWQVDTAADRFECDERCRSLLGIAEVTGRWPVLRDVLTPGVAEQDALRALLRGDAEFYEAETRVVREDGSVVWIATFAQVIDRAETGHRLVGASFDITQRKEAELRVESEVEFTRALINASPAFFVAFAQDGTILMVNDAFLAATGYTREELIGTEYISRFVPDADQADSLQARLALGSTPETTLIHAPVITRDGRILLVEWHARAALSSFHDFQFHFAVGLDITERRRQEDEMRSYVGFMDALHETTVDLLRHRAMQETLETVVRNATKLIGCSDAFVAMVFDKGQRARTIAAAGPSASFSGRTWETGQGVPGLVLQSGDSLLIDDYPAWRRQYGAESLDVASVAVVPMRTEGDVIGLLGIASCEPGKRFTKRQMSVLTRLAQLAALVVEHARLLSDAEREIGERVRAEEEILRLNTGLEETVRLRTLELSEANLELAATARLKDEFLANMSHELRTPLNAILGMSEVLEEGVHGAMNERQQRSVRVIVESATHLLELINDILDLAKIESGTVQLAVDHVQIRAVCESSVRMLREASQRKRIRLSVEVDRGVEQVDADERRLRQILVNLLSNAVKFTPEGGAVGIRVHADPVNDTIRFAVWDTGIGIPRDEIDRLFQPFVQLEAGSTRRYGGTGLGLSLVRRMAEMHGGFVEVESVVGEGSNFTVALPRISDRGGQQEKPVLPSATAAGPVVIIEDDRTAAQVVARYLTDLDLPVVISDASESILPLLERVRPRLVILDILLGTASGWEILSAIKGHPQLSATPVIIISVVDDTQRGLALGAFDYLVKPIRREQVESAITRLFPQIRGLATKQSNGVSVLLAEDNEANVEVIESYLTARGYQMILARDGVEAVDRTFERRPAVILMDVQMPRMSGLDAIRKIRAAESDGFRTPIIALTALAMRGDAERCLEAGADLYLTKPVSLRSLEEHIQQLILRAGVGEEIDSPS